MMAMDLSFAYLSSNYREPDGENSNPAYCYRAAINDRHNCITPRTFAEDLEAPFECVHSSSGVGAPIVDYEIVERKQTFTVCFTLYRNPETYSIELCLTFKSNLGYVM